MLLRILLIVAIVVLLVVAFRNLHKQPTRVVTHTPQPIDFTMQDINGKPIRLSSYRGKVVLIDVWATWCPYCVEELPSLMAAQQQAAQRGTPLQFLGIAMDDSIATVREFAARQHFNYPMLYRDEAQMQPFGAVRSFPTKFIVDKRGVLVDRIDGAVPMATLQQRITPYLTQ